MLKICSFNIQNTFFNHVNKTYHLMELIKKYKIDILAVQEYLFRDINSFKSDFYKCYGSGRLKFKNSVYNETNAIITSLKIVEEETIHLPWFITILPRIMTTVTFKYNKDDYILINTHLDYLHRISQKKQLKFIYNYLKTINNRYKIILLGDFNLTINSKMLKNFVDSLYDINIKRVDIADKTYKNLDHPIDHIFVSNTISVINKNVLVDKDFDISDHYPIYIEIK